MERVRASVVLPTYDEAGNILRLIEALRRSLGREHIRAEIIVVDDDSPDGTGFIAQRHYAGAEDVKVIVRRSERGLATAIRTGIEAAQGEILVVMDTDFNHDPELAPRLVDACRRYDFAVGSRYVQGGGMHNRLRELLSYLFNLLVRAALASPVHDNLSGFFAIRRSMLERLDYDAIFWGYGNYFMRLIYLAQRQQCSFAEFPAYYRERDYGISKSRFFAMFRDYLATIVSLRLSRA